MNIKKFYSTPALPPLGDVAVLLLRITAGVALMMHGWGKIQNPFGWMGLDATTPGIFQSLAAISEFGGGLALILGLLTPLASFGILCTMAVAVWTHAIKMGDPFVASGPGGSWELAAVYFCVAFTLIGVGPGRFSLDRKLFGAR